jgi:hypothetical protein
MFSLKSCQMLVVAAAVALATTCLVLTVPLSAAAREGGGDHGHSDGHVGGHFDGRGFGTPHGFHGAPGHFVGDGWYDYPNATYPNPQYWYYCPSAGAYYPYVSACPEGWTPVVPQ